MAQRHRRAAARRRAGEATEERSQPPAHPDPLRINRAIWRVRRGTAPFGRDRAVPDARQAGASRSAGRADAGRLHKAIGLRTEAAGRRIVGAHALRGTIERDLRQLGVGAEVRDALLGHVGQDGEYRQSAVARGYLGDDDRDTRLPDAMLREAIDRLSAPPVLPASLPPDLRLLPPRRGPKPRSR